MLTGGILQSPVSLPGQPSTSYIAVNFPTQNIAEQAYYEAGGKDKNTPDPNTGNLDPNSAVIGPGETVGGNTTLPGAEYTSTKKQAPLGETPDLPGNVGHMAAGWTRLVFIVPSGASISYTLSGILGAISTYDLNVTGTAALPPGTAISSVVVPILPPESTETAIEAPYRLIISPLGFNAKPAAPILPNIFARWAHSTNPYVPQSLAPKIVKPPPTVNVVELWHTRLAVKAASTTALTQQGGPDEIKPNNRTIRAVWAGTSSDPDVEWLLNSNYKPTSAPTNPNSAHDKITHYTSEGVGNVPGTNDNGAPLFRTSLDNRDRDEIVHLTSNFNLSLYRPYPPLAVPVNRLMLSSLGAWIDLDARFQEPLPGDLSVLEWRHLATMGRDHYVKVVYAGWLAPFGHRANLVKVTERKLIEMAVNGTDTVVAYMKQRMFIVVREPEKTYPALGQPWNGRRTPFKSLKITTLVTPSLVDPSSSSSTSQGASGQPLTQDAFWPQVPGPKPPNAQDFLFHFIATDWDGNTSQFSVPLIFIDTSVNPKDRIAVLTGTTGNQYMADLGRRTATMNGQKIAFTESLDPQTNTYTGKSSYETSSIAWASELYYKETGGSNPPSTIPYDEMGGDPGSSIVIEDQGLPVFYPAVDKAQVRISAIDQLTGTSTPPTVPITYHGGLDKSNQGFGYLWNEFGPASSNSFNTKLATNYGEVFAVIQNGIAVDVTPNLDKVGAMINPSLNYVGLSRLAGALPGNPKDIDTSLNNFFSGTGFDPIAALLPKSPQLPNFPTGLKILGGIDLSNILLKFVNLPQGSFTSPDFGDGKRVPKIVATVEYGGSPPTPKDILITLHWEPPIQSWDPILSPSGNPWLNDSRQPLFNVATPPGTPPIVLDGRFVKPLDPTLPPSYTVTGTINGPIELNLLPGGNQNPFFLITIPFKKLQFTAQTGGKTTASAVLGEIEYHGILSFIQELQSIIPSSGFEDPPFLNVTATGIEAGYNVGVPTIPVGAIIIKDIKLEASLNIPFIGDPARLKFGISERENPFKVTFTIFGGGGFFAMAMGLDGLESMEGALEFGAYLSVNLFVASGSVHAAVGIYFYHGQESDADQDGDEGDDYDNNPAQDMPTQPPPLKDVTELSGYCSIGGELEVLGLISVSTEFYLALDYFPDDNACEGQASLTVEVDVAFIHESVELGPIEKKFSHSPPLDQLAFGYLVPLNAWMDYVGAFTQ